MVIDFVLGRKLIYLGKIGLLMIHKPECILKRYQGRRAFYLYRI
jgi:hypothetical protein